MENTHRQHQTMETTLVTTTRKLKNAKIIAVSSMSSQRFCTTCKKGGIVSMEDNPFLGRCITCPKITLLSVCKLQISANKFHYHLGTYGQQLLQFAKTQSEVELNDMVL